MSSYKQTTLTRIELPTLVPQNVPLIVDDFSLAMHLGVRCKTVWYCVTQKKRVYKRFQIRKSSGKMRTIHNPSNILKFIQRRIAAVILNPLPLTDCVGAYVKGRGCRDSVVRHVGHEVRVGMDLKDFFPTHTRSRVRLYFHAHLGYSMFVSGLLADLCTAAEKRKRNDDTEYWRHFVPQGSPASPALCNLIAQESLDRRILKLIAGTGWVYTRYSDDLTLSHPDNLPRKDVDGLIREVRGCINDAGYRTNPKKQKIQRKRNTRQKMLGMVTNEHPNIPREVYMKYKAILTNCLRYGFEVNAVRYGMDVPEDDPKAAAGCFIAHLQGKISYFHTVNPHRAQKLQKQLQDAVIAHPEEMPDGYSLSSS